VSWQDQLPRSGVVGSHQIEVILDFEAIHRGDLEETGAVTFCEAETEEIPGELRAGSRDAPGW